MVFLILRKCTDSLSPVDVLQPRQLLHCFDMHLFQQLSFLLCQTLQLLQTVWHRSADGRGATGQTARICRSTVMQQLEYRMKQVCSCCGNVEAFVEAGESIQLSVSVYSRPGSTMSIGSKRTCRIETGDAAISSKDFSSESCNAETCVTFQTEHKSSHPCDYSKAPCNSKSTNLHECFIDVHLAIMVSFAVSLPCKGHNGFGHLVEPETNTQRQKHETLLLDTVISC